MKNKIFILIYFLLASHFMYTQEITVGMTLKTLTQNINENDLTNKTDLGLWLENEIYIYKIDGEDRLLVSMNYYPFGVITHKDGKSYFLIDFDGDSILDREIEYLYVPPWVIRNFSNGGNTGDTIKNMLKLSTSAFQGNDLPYENEAMKTRTKELVLAAKDRGYDDRPYIYYEYLYNYLYKKRELDSAYECLETLYISLNKEMDSTLLIYMVELANKRGQLDEARQINNLLITNFPNFIPGIVYQYILEENITIKNEYRNSLLEKNSNHWLVIEKVK